MEALVILVGFSAGFLVGRWWTVLPFGLLAVLFVVTADIELTARDRIFVALLALVAPAAVGTALSKLLDGRSTRRGLA